MQQVLPGAIFFCVINILSTAQPIDTVKKIDELFTSWNNSTPGGAIMVTRGENVLYDKAFGLADLERQVPNLTNTIFEAGSVSKQFTATAALLLVLEGKLALEDDVRKYIPELPAYDAPVRIQHLLNHTSGLKDWGSIFAIGGWPRTTRVYTQELALQMICRQKSLNFTPGAEYSYSNSNYTLLVSIVERVSAEKLADFTRKRLFEPAGMTDTQWRDDYREIIRRRALAYGKRDGKYVTVMPFEHVHGHGGLLTTTADLTRWNEQLVKRTIGGEKLYAFRIKQGPLNNGTKISYASGIVIGDYRGNLEISHSGATAGYRAYLLSYPDKKISIAILSNDGSFNAPAAGNAIAQIFLGKSEMPVKPTQIKLTGAQLKPWAGIYKSIRLFDVVAIDLEGDVPSLNKEPLVPIHKDTLTLNNERWTLTGQDRLFVKAGDDTITYARVKPPDISGRSLQSYTGTYHSAEADCSFSVEVRDNQLFLVNRPFDPIPLQPAFLDAFTIDDYDLVQFRRNKGSVVGFDFSTSRAERIPFTRQNK
jgi:CubicO group peptidase (beta-lactamase class C family)